MSEFVMGAEMRMTDNFSQTMTAAARVTDEFRQNAAQANQIVTTLSNATDEIAQSTQAFTDTMQDTAAAVDSVVAPTEQATQGVNKWKAAIQQFNRGTEVIKNLPGHIKQAAAQRLDGLENSIISTRLQAAVLVGGLKAVAKTKITNAVNDFKEFKATVTEGKSGLSGFATGLKNIGKISIANTYNVMRNLTTKVKEFGATKISGLVDKFKEFKNGVSSIKLSSLLTGIKNVAKVSLSALHQGIKKVGSLAIEAAGHVTSKLGSAVKTVAKGLVVGITAASVALGGMAVAGIQAGIAYESAFAGVVKTVDATPAQLKAINDGILEMTKVMPTSAVELAGVAEAAGQLGIETDNVLGFTKTMAMLGDATNMASNEAATTLAQFATVTGMTQDNFDRLGSTIVSLGNNFATTERDIANMAQNIASAGTQVGMSEAQILGFSAALSSVGMEAAAGGTAISKLMIDMQLATETGGESLKDFAKVAGMSTAEFKTAFQTDAAGAVASFMTGLSDTERLGSSAIAILDEMGVTETRLRDTILRGAGASDTFTKALEMGTQAWEENTALAKEAEQRYATMESQIGILKNSANRLGIAFYKDVNAPMAEVVSTANEMVVGLEDAFKKGGISGLVSEVGNVFAKIVTKIADAAPKVVEMAVSLIDNLLTGIAQNTPQIADGAAKAVTAFVKGIITLLPRVILIGADLLIQFASGLLKELPQLLAIGKDALVTLLEGLQAQLPQLIDIATQLIPLVADAILGNLPTLILAGIDLLLSFILGIVETIPALIPIAISAIQTLVNGLLSQIDLIIQAALTLVMGLVTGLMQSLPQLIQAAFQLLQAIINSILNNIQLIIDTALMLVNTLVVGLLENIPLLLQAALQLVLGIVNGLVSNIQLIVQGAISLIQALIQGIIANLPAIIQAAVHVVIALAVGLIQAIPQLVAAVPQLIGAIIETIFTTNWLQVGLDVVKGIGKGLWDGIKGIFGGAGKKGGEDMVSGAVEGAASGLDAITDASTQTAANFTTGLQPDYGTIGSYGVEAGNSLTAGLTSSTGDLTASATNVGVDMATGLSDGFTFTMPTVVDTANLMGVESVTGLSTGMTDNLGLATDAATTVTTGVTDVFGGIDLKPSGTNAMQGFIDGMNAMRGSVMSVAKDIADSVKLTINSALDIHSPSRVLEESGEFTGEGFVNGLTKMIDRVKAAAQGLSDTTVEPFATKTAGTISPSGVTKAPATKAEGLKIIIERLILENVGEKDPKELVREILRLLYEELSGADEVLSLGEMGALL